MKKKYAYFVTFSIIAISLFFFGCDTNNSNTTVIVSDNSSFSIDTFSIIPNEIDGCSCYFSNNKSDFEKGIYIYANDFAEISFLKINGTMTKFIQSDFKKIDSIKSIIKAKSANYDLIIEKTLGKSTGDESSQMSGTITIIDNKGKSRKVSFFGECGC